MSIAAVRAYFAQLGMEDKILEFETSSATVELAAQAAGVIPARIAKSLSFKVDGKAILIIAAGDAKVDNSKFKAFFHTKAKMLTPDEVVELVGHAVGGVCPFAVRHHGDTGPLAPYLQLLNRSGPESIRCPQNYAFALLLQPKSQLSDGCCFSNTVYSDN